MEFRAGRGPAWGGAQWDSGDGQCRQYLRHHILGRPFQWRRVVRLAPDGTYTVLHHFGETSTDGYHPYNIALDAQGSIYGTPPVGGAFGAGGNVAPWGNGTVYKVTPDGTYSILHSFPNTTKPGGGPTGELTFDGQGNLYGAISGRNGQIFKIGVDGKYSSVFKFPKSQRHHLRG